MPSKSSALALAAALITSLPSVVRAQDLRELYASARSFDATVLAARAQARSAEFRVAQSDALALPSAALTASLSASQFDAPVVGNGDSNSGSARLGGRYPLYNRANGVAIEQARKSLALSVADLDSAEQDLVVRVAQAYFDVLATQDSLATTRTKKAATSEQLASAKRNFEVGTATITDTREAQARFDLDVAQEIAADNELRVRRIALDQLVGRVGVEPRPLALPTALPAVQPADPEAWVGTADAQHPTVRRALATLEIAQLEIDRARAADRPTLDAVGSVGIGRQVGSFVATPGNTTSATLGIELNWPLYSGGATGNRISETLALEERSRNDLAAARRGVAQGTRVAYFGVQSGAAQVRALEAAESSTRLALEATQLGYRVGVRVNLDVLNAQALLFQTQRDLAKARYDVLVGGLRLRQAAGQLTAADLDAVNALLAR